MQILRPVTGRRSNASQPFPATVASAASSAMAGSSAINSADPINRGHPLNRGRVAWWLTLPGAVGGGTWRDITNQRNTGVLTSMGNSSNGFRTTNRPGGWGGIQCDGTAGYISAGNVLGFTAEPFALAVWMRTADANPAFRAIVGKGYLVSAAGYGHYLDTVGHVAFQVRNGAVVSGAISTAAVNDGKWHRVIGTRIAGVTSLYVDGLLAATDSTAVTIGTDTQRFLVGTRDSSGATALYYLGTVDDVSVWNRALSPAEVLQDYNLSQRGYPGVLNRLQWSMNFAAVASGNHFRRTNQFAKRTGCRQST